MDPEGETDNVRFLGTARRLEEEGYVIANKTGPNVRDYSSLSDARGHPSGRGGSTGIGHHRRGPVSAW
jgi:hypothetical protein